LDVGREKNEPCLELEPGLGLATVEVAADAQQVEVVFALFGRIGPIGRIDVVVREGRGVGTVGQAAGGEEDAGIESQVGVVAEGTAEGPDERRETGGRGQFRGALEEGREELPETVGGDQERTPGKSEE
jgi:hypothetical protein